MSDQLLGSFLRCPVCGEYRFSRMHRCPPLWEARRPNNDEWQQVRAATAERAAEVFAQLTDRWGESDEVAARQTVLVRRLGDEALATYEVRGEIQPVYIARPTVAPMEAR
jgi:hypothetical protein